MVKSAKRRKQRAAKRPAPAKASKPARQRAKAARSRGPAPKPTVIDVHAHVLVPEVVKRTYDQSQYSRAVAGPGGVPEPLLQAHDRSCRCGSRRWTRPASTSR